MSVPPMFIPKTEQTDVHIGGYLICFFYGTHRQEKSLCKFNVISANNIRYFRVLNRFSDMRSICDTAETKAIFSRLFVHYISFIE